jgi:hypothetical protein
MTHYSLYGDTAEMWSRRRYVSVKDLRPSIWAWPGIFYRIVGFVLAIMLMIGLSFMAIGIGGWILTTLVEVGQRFLLLLV